MKILVQDYPFSTLWKMKGSILKTATSPTKVINFLKAKRSAAKKSTTVSGMPFNILIEPTRHCNYSCLMCPRQTVGLAKKKIDKPAMSFEEFKQIMDEIGKYLITIRFWHFGEPLLAPDFFKMVKYAKKKKIMTATSSNLEALTPEKAEEMIDSGLDYLILNFNGATKETYEKYAGKKNTFEKVVRNIEVLVQKKKESKSWHPFIDLQFIIMKENDNEIKEMKKLGERLGVDKVCFKLVMALSEEKKKELESNNPNFQLHIQELNKECKFCSLPWEETVISSNGEVSPCAVDTFNDFKMGNVFEQPFKQIWNNEKYQEFRKKIAEDIDKVKICSYCGKRNNPDFYVKV